jgi:hypothetical protein
MWVVGICALFMITIGGFSYMTSAGNTSKASVGKGIITDALIGLILALVAVLLFTVINPNITAVNLQITPVSTSGTGTGEEPVTPTTPANCTGDVPANSTICTSTEPDAQTEITLVSTCAEAPCTYKCNTTFKLEGGKCVGSGKVTYDSSGADCDNVTPQKSIDQFNSGACSTTCNITCKSGTPCSACVKLSSGLVDAINKVGETNVIRVSSLTGGQHTSAKSSHYLGKAADIVPKASKSDWDAIVSQFKSAGCSSNQTFCDKGGKPVSCSQADHIHITC